MSENCNQEFTAVNSSLESATSWQSNLSVGTCKAVLSRAVVFSVDAPYSMLVWLSVHDTGLGTLLQNMILG